MKPGALLEEASGTMLCNGLHLPIFLRAGHSQIILAGDDKQLPGYKGTKVRMPSILTACLKRHNTVEFTCQYRLSPCIASVVSNLFYGNRMYIMTSMPVDIKTSIVFSKNSNKWHTCPRMRT